MSEMHRAIFLDGPNKGSTFSSQYDVLVLASPVSWADPDADPRALGEPAVIYRHTPVVLFGRKVNFWFPNSLGLDTEVQNTYLAEVMLNDFGRGVLGL